MALRLSRDARNGLLTGTSLAGVTTSNGYNEFGETSSFSSSSALISVQCSRNALGRITQKVETIDGVTTSKG